MAEKQEMYKSDISFFIDEKSALINALHLILKKNHPKDSFRNKPYCVCIGGGEVGLPLSGSAARDLDQVRDNLASLNKGHPNANRHFDYRGPMASLPTQSMLNDTNLLHQLENEIGEALIPKAQNAKLITIQHPEIFNNIYNIMKKKYHNVNGGVVKFIKNHFGKRIIYSNKSEKNSKKIYIDCLKKIDYLHAWTTIVKELHSETLNVVSVFSDEVNPGSVVQPIIYNSGYQISSGFWNDIWRSAAHICNKKLCLEDEHRQRNLASWSTSNFDELSYGIVIGGISGKEFDMDYDYQYKNGIRNASEALADFFVSMSNDSRNDIGGGINDHLHGQKHSRYLGLTTQMIQSEAIVCTNKSAFGAVISLMEENELYNADPFQIIIGYLSGKHVLVILSADTRPSVDAVMSDLKFLLGVSGGRIIFLGRGTSSNDESHVVIPTQGIFTAVPQQNPNRLNTKAQRLSCLPIQDRLTQCITGDYEISQKLVDSALKCGLDCKEGIVTGLDSVERDMYVDGRNVTSRVVACKCKGYYDALEYMCDEQSQNIQISGIFVTGIDCMNEVARMLCVFYGEN